MLYLFIVTYNTCLKLENICINVDLRMTKASILSILVEVHYYAPAKVMGRGHIVAAT